MSMNAGWIILVVIIALLFIIPVAVIAYIAHLIEQTIKDKEIKWDE